MRNLMILSMIGVLTLLGCADEKVQQEKDQLQKKNDELAGRLVARDKFIVDVTAMINDIHENLEATWAKENRTVRRATTTEGNTSATPAEVKERIPGRISDMNTVIMESRRKMAALEKKLAESGKRYAGLQKMVDDLRNDIESREQSIARLKARVGDRETDVSQKTQVIAADENTIGQQTMKLNEVYYVAGTKDDLKQKGIIRKEGGILWGLLGTTTVLVSTFDDNNFHSLDKTKGQIITLNAPIDEIVPPRDTSMYTMVRSEDGQTLLKITNPVSFWRERHLVIVTEQ
jgi:hypothetical protein